MRKYLFIPLFIFSLAFSSSLQSHAAYTAREIGLRSSANSLFSQCLNRQRVLAVKIMTGAEDAAAAQTKLDESAGELGKIFVTYFGDQRGAEIAELFKQYFQSTAEYAGALRRVEDKAAITGSMNAKAGEIVLFFNSSSPVWKKSGLSAILAKYTELIINELELQNKSLNVNDAQPLAATFQTSQELADAVATGIVRQFRELFKK